MGEEEARRKEEQRKKEEEEKRKREEDDVRRQEEAKKRRIEEEKRDREQIAVDKVRLVMKKLRSANPGTHKVLVADLKAAMAAHLPLMGDNAAKVTQEAEKALKQ